MLLRGVDAREPVQQRSQKANIGQNIGKGGAMPAFTNAKQSIPSLFVAIIENDSARDAIKAKGASMTHLDWTELGRLTREKRDFRSAAEKALSWNADKGRLA